MESREYIPKIGDYLEVSSESDKSFLNEITYISEKSPNGCYMIELSNNCNYVTSAIYNPNAEFGLIFMANCTGSVINIYPIINDDGKTLDDYP